MKQRRIDLILLQLLVLCVAGIMVSRMLEWSMVSSLLFTATFPLTGLLWLWTVYRHGFTKMDGLMLVTGALAAVCVVVDLVRWGGSFSPSYFRKLIMFYMTLLFLQAADKVKADSQLQHFIQIPVDVVTICMAVMYLFCRDRMYMINGIVSRYLTFGFSNPNMLCMFLTCMYMLTFCMLTQPGDRRQKIFCGVVLGLQLIFILLTQSRNGLMITALFTGAALCVIYREKIRRRFRISISMRIGKWTAIVIVVFPMVFAVLYMLLVDAEWIGKLFGFMVSEGKQLDSRVKMWAPAFEAVTGAPLTGSYFGISDGTGTGQMHSTHVDIAASYGIPVLILVGCMLYRYIHQQGKVYARAGGFLYMVAFCCAVLMGTFEAAVFSGGLGIYVLAIVFLPLSKMQPGIDAEPFWEIYGAGIKKIFSKSPKGGQETEEL